MDTSNIRTDPAGASSANDPGEQFGLRLSHVGVAVPKLDAAADVLNALFGYKTVSGPFDDPIQKVTVSFLKQTGDDAAEIELIAPLTEDAPIRSMLAKGSGAAYHLCFETTDLEGALAHMKSNGCIIVSPPVPAVAFAGRRIAWFYTPTNQLFELVEALKSS
jgi:methylmalonyl-CoA/ethylmalonyl-CoA epimerase